VSCILAASVTGEGTETVQPVEASTACCPLSKVSWNQQRETGRIFTSWSSQALSADRRTPQVPSPVLRAAVDVSLWETVLFRKDLRPDYLCLSPLPYWGSCKSLGASAPQNPNFTQGRLVVTTPACRAWRTGWLLTVASTIQQELLLASSKWPAVLGIRRKLVRHFQSSQEPRGQTLPGLKEAPEQGAKPLAGKCSPHTFTVTRTSVLPSSGRVPSSWLPCPLWHRPPTCSLQPWWSQQLQWPETYVSTPSAKETLPGPSRGPESVPGQ
jgi:hypothetical protein